MLQVIQFIADSAITLINSIFSWKITNALTFGAYFMLPITALLVFKIMQLLFGGATISRIPSSRPNYAPKNSKGNK